MKMLCETQVVNRQFPQSKPIRSTKATVAIGVHPPLSSLSTAVASTSSSSSARAAVATRARSSISVTPSTSTSSSSSTPIASRTRSSMPAKQSTSQTKPEPQLFIIHFNEKNKVGQRYKVKDNIQKMYTKFLHDGKITISFKIPEHDLLIKCDPIQLKCFFRIMRLSPNNNNVDMGNRNFGLTTLATTPIPDRLRPIYKLYINKVSDLPIKALPKTLKVLHMNNVRLSRFSPQLFQLNNLTKLDLSENCIKHVPKEIGNLSLNELIISSNNLGIELNENNGLEQNNATNMISYQKKWCWLDGKRLRKSLKCLDMSNNQLTEFPYNIVKLDNLITLKLNCNEIQKIPFGIRRLKNLRYLHLNTNKLISVPYTLSLLRLQVLDLWKNAFSPINDSDYVYSKRECITMQPLWVKAAQIVLNNRIPYSESTIPSLLVDFLSEMPVCICGKLCYSDNINQIIHRIRLLNFDNVKLSLFYIRDYLIYADVIFCSPKCFYKNMLDLMAFNS